MQTFRPSARTIAAGSLTNHPLSLTFWEEAGRSRGLARRCFWAVILMFWVIAGPGSSYANNVSIANVKLVAQDKTRGTITLQFDLSWDNAWKDSVNNDAVWVFFKYSKDTGSTWSHVTLKNAGTNPTGSSWGIKGSTSFTARLDLIVPSDKKGCFIQPQSNGSGTVNFTKLKLLWDYRHDGLTDAEAIDAINTSVKAFAVEMVYIPEEGFYAGDGSAGTNGELEFGGASASKPGPINDEKPLSFGNSATQWYYNTDSQSNDDSAGATFEVSEAFPKGYKAFYLMKYEMTEGQWVGFFNTLTDAQKATRDITSSTGKNSDDVVNRNTIAWTSGNATTSKANRACGYLSWMDYAAYADWAALRPMTELEFEKASRGPLSPVSGEYAWGTTSKTNAATISGTEDGTETITTSGANVVFGGVTYSGGDAGSGPLRGGIFATASTTTRSATGAGYYGNMELSGNLWEQAVTLGNSAGRGFSGTHGDGILTSTSSYEGNATNLDWPGMDATSNARGVTGGTGSGFRGGGYADTGESLSSRKYAGYSIPNRMVDNGGRCARTAPE